MVRVADRVVVVTDSSKLGVDKLQAILPFEDLHTFITDAGAPAEFVQMLKEKGVSVLLAPIS
jgi:DeoR/GlpR family transcriptional regulator of sugar metabolism